MVRRWSYINLINSVKQAEQDLTPSYLTKIDSLGEALFRAITYYPLPLFSENLTKLIRKSFARLRHTKNLFIYQNILSNWSQEYLALRKNLRLFLSIRLYKYNYFLGTSTQFFTKDESTFFYHNNLVSWPVRKSFFRKSLSFNKTFAKFLLRTTPLNMVMASSPVLIKAREDSLYLDMGTSLGPISSTQTFLDNYRKILHLLFRVYLTSLTPIYSSLITLTLLKS